MHGARTVLAQGKGELLGRRETRHGGSWKQDRRVLKWMMRLDLDVDMVGDFHHLIASEAHPVDVNHPACGACACLPLGLRYPAMV